MMPGKWSAADVLASAFVPIPVIGACGGTDFDAAIFDHPELEGFSELEGMFTSTSNSGGDMCGLRSDGSIACWG